MKLGFRLTFTSGTGAPAETVTSVARLQEDATVRLLEDGTARLTEGT